MSAGNPRWRPDVRSDLPITEELLILAVDDTPANLVALERVLGSVGARVVRAGSGEEALGLCLRHRFALAILDVQMPEMDGYELAEILLADEATSRIPIIFMTAAFFDDSHVFRGYTTGAVDYIIKPYHPECPKRNEALLKVPRSWSLGFAHRTRGAAGRYGRRRCSACR